MGLENVPRCQHVKINGTQCGSPALRSRRFCFFHRRMVEQRARIAADPFLNRPLELPVLEDANSVQMALMQVMQGLVAHTIDHKTAGLLLYGLQSAAVNVKNVKFEPSRPTEVVIDRDTVHLTVMDGPQWFEEDFEEEEESEEEDGEVVGEKEDESEIEAEEEDAPEVSAQNEVKALGEVKAEKAVKASEKGEGVQVEKGVEAPAAARKPVQSAGEKLRERLAVRAGENPVEAMKRLMTTMGEMERSG